MIMLSYNYLIFHIDISSSLISRLMNHLLLWWGLDTEGLWLFTWPNRV